MRIFVLLPMAAAALAITAIATWGPGFFGSRTAAPYHRSPPGTGSARASEATASATSGPKMIAAAPRYRAETCGGDYVCRESGAWEPAEVWTLTSDGF
ncbi:MAG TPA: hypothetical protein VG758_00415 [Hyphomicrobiaceae bacterium]|jgi:hypothetical protein|nr:hypothetical protein [Hyphomicrobiaceae bacterium]